jgi:hypothetical protein
VLPTILATAVPDSDRHDNLLKIKDNIFSKKTWLENATVNMWDKATARKGWEMITA